MEKDMSRNKHSSAFVPPLHIAPTAMDLPQTWGKFPLLCIFKGHVSDRSKWISPKVASSKTKKQTVFPPVPTESALSYWYNRGSSAAGSGWPWTAPSQTPALCSISSGEKVHSQLKKRSNSIKNLTFILGNPRLVVSVLAFIDILVILSLV